MSPCPSLVPLMVFYLFYLFLYFIIFFFLVEHEGLWDDITFAGIYFRSTGEGVWR